MTKKDYVLLARVLNEFYLWSDEYIAKKIAYTLAEELAKENPRFNKDKFFKACFKKKE